MSCCWCGIQGNNLSSVQRLSLLGSAFALVLPPEARAKDTSVPLCEPCAMDVSCLVAISVSEVLG